MQISDFFVFILSNFPLSLNLKLISITFDLDGFNVNLFASIHRWRFSSSVFASFKFYVGNSNGKTFVPALF